MITKMSKSKNEKIQPNYFYKEKRLLKTFGLSFSGKESTGYKIYAWVFFFSVNFMYPVLQSKELFTQNFEVIADMLIYLMAAYLALAKGIVVLRNRIRFGKMLARLEQEPFIVNLERGGMQEEEIIKDCLWFTNMQTLVYWVVGFTTIFSNMIYCIVQRIRSNNYKDWDLPFGPWTVSNVTYSPNYEIILFYQCLSGTSVCSYLYTIDLLMAAVLAHISYQFKILQNNFRRLVKNSYLEMQKDSTGQTFSLENYTTSMDVEPSKISWKYLHKHLEQAIAYHREVISLAEDMENVFSTLLLIVFLGALIMLCCSIYRASMVNDSVMLLINLLDASTSCLQVLVLCYWGEQTVLESEQVGRAVYEANFVGADLRFQRNLVLIIRRSQNVTKLTAGKFTDICLSTFTWIMRASYSALMVLRGTASNRIQTTEE